MDAPEATLADAEVVNVAPVAAPPLPARIAAGAPGAGVAGAVGVAVGLAFGLEVGEAVGLAAGEADGLGVGVETAVTVTDPGVKPEVMYSPVPASA